LIQDALVGGPDALSKAQKAILLGDPLTLSRLHFQVWTSAQAHPGWLGNTHAVERRHAPSPRLAAAAG
jgi:membrane glycosyltransferase